MATAEQPGPVPPIVVAEALGVTSRQVSAWASRRATNGFPEPITIVHGRHGGPAKVAGYDLAEVTAWAANYSPNSNRGAHWANQAPRTRVTGPCVECGRDCDRMMTDPAAPLRHKRCER